MRKIVAVFALILATSSVTAAEPPDVQTLVHQLKAVFEPERPSIRKVFISMDVEGETVQWVASQALKTLPDGKWLLTVIREPESLKGNAFLVHEPKAKPSSIWMYLPATRRVRQLVPVDIYQRFLGTDFTYADLGFVRLHEEYRLLGEEEHEGVRAYKIEEVVRNGWAYYSRILIWVAVDSMLPLQRDYYDLAGELWKTERFEGVTDVDGVSIPLQITMQDVHGKTSTAFTMEQVQYDVQIPDALFDPAQLPRAATSPVWQVDGSSDASEQ